jgi:hypothetical protein
VIWQDTAGRPKLRLTLDAADHETLATFRQQVAEREAGGNDGSYRVRPVSPCWLDAQAGHEEAPPEPTGMADRRLGRGCLASLEGVRRALREPLIGKLVNPRPANAAPAHRAALNPGATNGAHEPNGILG